MLDYPIVDSHFHIWDLNYLRYPWLDTRGILNQSYSFDDFLKAHGDYRLDGAVYCECTSVDYVKEAQYVVDQSKIHPQIKGVVSWIHLENTDTIISELERIKKSPMIKGVRRMLKKAENREKLCLTKEFIDGMRLLPKYGLIYDMGIVPELMPPCYEMMKQCPETRFVVEHCAEPDIVGGGYKVWAEGIKKFASLPNVWVKLSGFMTHVDKENWKVDDMRPYAEYLIEQFGYDRIMYGSDWPPVNQTADLHTWVEICEELYSGESEENKRKFFRENAISFYGLDMK